MVFSHVDFDNCTFQSVEFNNIKSSKTHFTHSIIVHSKYAFKMTIFGFFLNVKYI